MLGRVLDPPRAPRQSPREEVLPAPGHLAGSEQNGTQIQDSPSTFKARILNFTYLARPKI